MTCKQCRKWWSPYLDSELDASKTFELSEHLRGCEACRDRFEREQFVDDLVRRKLQESHMPDATWHNLCEQIRTPRRITPFFSQRTLALAASVMLFVSAGLVYRNMQPSSPQVELKVTTASKAVTAPKTSVADLLRSAAPRLAAFSQKPDPRVYGKLETLGREILAATITLDAAAVLGHKIDLIDVQERTDAAGVRYVELRVNCCGQPVLLALSERGHNHAISEFSEMCTRCPSQGPPSPRTRDGIETHTIERDGVILAGAAADHHLDGLFAAISITRT